MPHPITYSFTRYLSAKKTIDDRALNRNVWQHLSQALPGASSGHPLCILEIGAGIGTMLERMLTRGLIDYAQYTAIDSQHENIASALQRLPQWAAANGYRLSRTQSNLTLAYDSSRQVEVILEPVELFDFAAQNQLHRRWDLLVANALLDLMDIHKTLPVLFELLNPNGLFYFTINFDGETILEPIIDAPLDRQIVDLYHRSMDERMIAGVPSGDSQAGRHLFAHLPAAGGEILAAGSSDWVVFAGPQGYTHDEAYFLHFIIETIYRQLIDHPELETRIFEQWVKERHIQIKRGELVYIAHQLDFLGRVRK